METFWIVVLVIVIVAANFVIRRLFSKAGSAVERKIRSGAAASEDEVLETVVCFRTTAPLDSLRQAVRDNVTIVSESIWKGGKMKVLHDSERGIAWEAGSISLGNGFKAALEFSQQDDDLVGEYAICDHVMNASSGISPFLEKMKQTQSEVIAAFKSLDPGVKIETRKQSVTRKTSWF